MFPTLLSLLKIAIGLIVLTQVWKVTYNLFLSPLKAVPGPFLAKITPQWLVFYDMAGARTCTIHKLHLKYGPAVRVGPDEVSFSSIETIKELYGPQTNFVKAPWYEYMSMQPLGLFSLTDRAVHGQRRRLFSQVFTQSNLYESEALILQHVLKLKDRIRHGLGKPLDMLTLFRLASFDIVGDLFRGQSFCGLDMADPPQFLHDMESLFILNGLRWSFPLVHYLLHKLPIRSLKHFLDSYKRIVKVRERENDRQQAFANYTRQYGRDSGRQDLISKVLKIKYDTGEAPMTDKEIYTEVGNLLFAGTDTTSTTLTYMFFELARQSEWQTRIRDELRSAKVSMLLDPPSGLSRKIQDLPVLDAVVNESLRLHPAAPASLPRVTPRGGKVLDGYSIPEKTIVSVQCYTTQRDPIAFPDPENFNPDRWLAPNMMSDDCKQLFMPFAHGARGCIGKHLATMELKLITAALIESYEVTCAPNTTDESMAMTDHFLVVPKAGRCDLVFRKASDRHKAIFTL